MAIANLALRFILELVGVAAFGYWGLQASDDQVLRLVVGLGAPAAIVVLWAVLVAPNSASPLTQPQRDVLGTGILLVAAIALVAAGQPTAGLVFAVITVANAVLLVAIGTAARDALASGRHA